MFARYLQHRNVWHVTEQLEREGLRSPARQTLTGKSYGGMSLSQGQIYGFLKCATYTGEVYHKRQVYPGLHDPILSRDT